MFVYRYGNDKHSISRQTTSIQPIEMDIIDVFEGRQQHG